MVQLNPEEAVQVGQDIGSVILIAMHWGTIKLSDEPHWEPPRRFSGAASKAGYAENRTWCMKMGETRILTAKESGISEPESEGGKGEK